jgi:hypothetical protein
MSKSGTKTTTVTLDVIPALRILEIRRGIDMGDWAEQALPRNHPMRHKSSHPQDGDCTFQKEDLISEKSLERVRKEFDAWWKPQTKCNHAQPWKSGRFAGCSENWGAWQAWQMAKLGKVVEN